MDQRFLYNVATAQQFASQGRTEEWVHAYLNGGPWANLALSEGLKLQRRWWRGPIEQPLEQLVRCVGPEAGMEYPVSEEYWANRTGAMAESIRAAGLSPRDLPPLIAIWDGQSLSVRDGNHRHGAYHRLEWNTAWVLIWYNNEEAFHSHQIFYAGCA